MPAISGITPRLSQLFDMGWAKETTFGTFKTSDHWAKVKDFGLAPDPKVIMPPLLRGVLDEQVEAVAGIQHNNGNIVLPIYPDAGMPLFAAAIGYDAGNTFQPDGVTASQSGFGMQGTDASNLTTTPISTTITSPVSIGGTTATLTSATGFASNQVVVFEPGTTRAEAFLITLSGSTVTLVAGLGAASAAKFASAHAGSTAIAVIGAWSTGSLTTASTSVTLLAGLGAHFAAGDLIQIDFNIAGTSSSEIHTVSTVTTDTLNFTDHVCYFSHASNIAVFKVVAPLNHYILPCTSSPSFTFEGNYNGADIQYSGSVIDKMDIKLAMNAEAEVTYAVEAQQRQNQVSPSTPVWPTDISLAPPGFTASIGGFLDLTISQAALALANSVKVYDTFAGVNYPSVIVKAGRKGSFNMTAFAQAFTGGLSAFDYFSELNLSSGLVQLQAVVLNMVQGVNSIAITIPAGAETKFAPKLRSAEVVELDVMMSGIYSATSGNSISAIVANSDTVPY